MQGDQDITFNIHLVPLLLAIFWKRAYDRNKEYIVRKGLARAENTPNL